MRMGDPMPWREEISTICTGTILTGDFDPLPA